MRVSASIALNKKPAKSGYPGRVARSRSKFVVLTPLWILGPCLLVGCAPTSSADDQRIERLEQEIVNLNAEVVTIRSELAKVDEKIEAEDSREARIRERREALEKRRAERRELRDPFGDDADEADADPGPPTPLPMPVTRTPLPDPDPVKDLIDTVECEPGRCTFSRAAFEDVLANPAALAKSARIVPAIRDGETHGFKFYGIRRGSLPKAIGMKNGDLVTSVNGEEMNSLDQAMALYTKLRRAKTIELMIERKGKRHTLMLEAK